MLPCVLPFLQPGLPAQNFSMSVTVPVSNPNTLTYSNPGSSLVSPSLAASSSLTDTTMLSPPQTTLHRNVSPGAPQRPPSTGNAGMISVLLCFPFFSFLYVFIKKQQQEKKTHNFFFQWFFFRWNAGDNWPHSAKWSWYQSSW